MPSYSLTKSAQNDIRDIARYTRDRWGKDQAMRYAGLIDKCFDDIVNKRISEKSVSDALPGIFYQRVQKHVVFYARSEDFSIVIIAVLHERMDLVNRLKQRLK